MGAPLSRTAPRRAPAATIAPTTASAVPAAVNRPVIGTVRDGNSSFTASPEGGTFYFSNLPYAGSLGNNPSPVPVVGVASGG